MLHRILAATFVAFAVLLTGCASGPVQTSLPLDARASGLSGSKVGVMVVAPKQADTYFPGASCLLCIGVASLAHSSLTAQVKTWSVQEFTDARTEFVKRLADLGAKPVALADIDLKRFADRPKALNQSPRDYGALVTSDGLDKLLLVQIDALGVTRNYSAYIPSGPPHATVNGVAYLVDLPTQALQWYEPIRVSVAPTGEWDEPPKFPGMTNAYFQAVEQALDIVRRAFARQP